jgi:hypothetical protein
MQSDVGQAAKECVPVTRQSNRATAFRNGTFRKVSNRMAQRSLVNAFRNDRGKPDPRN